MEQLDCWRSADHRIPWDYLSQQSWAQAMQGCPQNPVYHGEGDVWTHTKLVVEALRADPDYWALGEAERRVLFWVTLLHDVAKPQCTTKDWDGNWTSPHHGPKGAVRARRLLWEMGHDPRERELICNLIRFHMQPFSLIDRPDWEGRLAQMACCIEPQKMWLLTLQARADARGRVCSDLPKLLDQVSLFGQLQQEFFQRFVPFFGDSDCRVRFFSPSSLRDPHIRRRVEHGCQVTVMSGLPASGKDTWVARHGQGLPCISLDDLRRQRGLGGGESPAGLIEQARERARELLRLDQEFIWNATNTSREIRGKILQLLRDYRASIRIVHCEVSAIDLERRNSQRENPVPAVAIEKMLGQWEPPDWSECHNLEGGFCLEPWGGTQ